MYIKYSFRHLHRWINLGSATNDMVTSGQYIYILLWAQRRRLEDKICKEQRADLRQVCVYGTYLRFLCTLIP